MKTESGQAYFVHVVVIECYLVHVVVKFYFTRESQQAIAFLQGTLGIV